MDSVWVGRQARKYHSAARGVDLEPAPFDPVDVALGTASYWKGRAKYLEQELALARRELGWDTSPRGRELREARRELAILKGHGAL